MAPRILIYLNTSTSRPLMTMSRACLAFALQAISRHHFRHDSTYQRLVLQRPSILSQLPAPLGQHPLAPLRRYGFRSPHLKALGVKMKMKRQVTKAEMKVKVKVRMATNLRVRTRRRARRRRRRRRRTMVRTRMWMRMKTTASSNGTIRR
jgi:hypothetical protein